MPYVPEYPYPRTVIVSPKSYLCTYCGKELRWLDHQTIKPFMVDWVQCECGTYTLYAPPSLMHTAKRAVLSTAPNLDALEALHAEIEDANRRPPTYPERTE
jgi:hypothetical protein